MNPDNVLSGMREGNIFSLCARKSDNWLLLGAPRDGTKTDEEGVARNGMAMKVGSPVRV